MMKPQRDKNGQYQKHKLRYKVKIIGFIQQC